MIKERIIQLLEYKNIPKEDFYVKIGMTSASFRGSAKKSPLNSNAIENILSEISDVNPIWLLTGQGPMLREEKGHEVMVNRLHNPPYREKISDSEVPLYNIDAAANLKTLFDNKHQNIIDSLKIPDLPKCDGAIYIRGDSMYPLLKAGDIVIYKEIPDFNHLIYGEIYLVDYNISGEDYLVIKYVKRSQLPGHIQLVSYNPHHDALDIPVQNCIRAMALVKASVRLNMMM